MLLKNDAVWVVHLVELGTRVPLIFKAPHLPKGVVSNLIVESVDLYPLRRMLSFKFVLLLLGLHYG